MGLPPMAVSAPAGADRLWSQRGKLADALSHCGLCQHQGRTMSHRPNAPGRGSRVCMDADRRRLHRRDFITSGLAALAGTLLLPRAVGAGLTAEMPSVPIGGGHSIIRRESWGGDLTPRDSLSAEERGDVRFFLVHHSATPNGYTQDRAVEYLRSFYRYHTSPAKGWADIAYNFLVDAYGRIFEGRTGSIGKPIRGDATGGSQGFALLCCFVGDHSVEPPTREAVDGMAALLAWLAQQYNIDTSPGAKAEFESRGSNLHPRGKIVETATITGHRHMSRTTCPGNAANLIVDGRLPKMVTALVVGARDAAPAPSEQSAVEEPTVGDDEAAMPSDGAAPAGDDPAPSGHASSDGASAPPSLRTVAGNAQAPEKPDDDAPSVGAVEAPTLSEATLPTSGQSPRASTRQSDDSSGLGESATAAVLPIGSRAGAAVADAVLLQSASANARRPAYWVQGPLAGGAAALFGVILWRHRRLRPLAVEAPSKTPEPHPMMSERRMSEPGLGRRPPQP